MLGLGLFRNKGESVCQEHLQIATNGIYPGFSTFNMALNGFGCSVEIEIKPVEPPKGGGGAGPRTLWDDAKPYEIIVKVSYKGKQWEERRRISVLMAKSLEKVMVTFKSFRHRTIEVLARINTILKQNITVNVFRKNKERGMK